MALSLRNLILILVLLAGVSWWLLHENPEAEVRHAHEELLGLLNKAEDDSGSVSLLTARRLQSLFAPSVGVRGDAEGLAGTYTPEQMVAIIVRVQGLFSRIELKFSDLSVEFPADDEAVTRFTAVLTGTSPIADYEEVAETRDVISRMQKIDGDWLFAEFRLTAPAGD